MMYFYDPSDNTYVMVSEHKKYDILDTQHACLIIETLAKETPHNLCYPLQLSFLCRLWLFV